MKKRDFGIRCIGDSEYLSFVVYEMANGKYKCYRHFTHNSKLYDNYKKNYGSEKIREKKLTYSARLGIVRFFNSYKDSINWIWNII